MLDRPRNARKNKRIALAVAPRLHAPEPGHNRIGRLGFAAAERDAHFALAQKRNQKIDRFWRKSGEVPDGVKLGAVRRCASGRNIGKRPFEALCDVAQKRFSTSGAIFGMATHRRAWSSVSVSVIGTLLLNAVLFLGVRFASCAFWRLKLRTAASEWKSFAAAAPCGAQSRRVL